MKKWLLAFAPILVACGPGVHLEKIDTATAPELATSIKVLSEKAASVNGQNLGEIQATSCKNKAWNASPSNENAILQMKSIARKKGGNAISNVYCEPPLGTTLSPNCWSSIRCTSTVLLVTG